MPARPGPRCSTRARSSAIGAIAIAPSNPNVIYAGGGQPEPRYDVQSGRGIYKSTDGGKTWTDLGLHDTRYIGRIWVSPTDPNVVVVAAVGHFFGASDARGIYRSTDGGKTWTHPVAPGGFTGANDIAADPQNPRTLFASTWDARQWPWQSYFTEISGPGSGVWRSDDQGAHWRRLIGRRLADGTARPHQPRRNPQGRAPARLRRHRLQDQRRPLALRRRRRPLAARQPGQRLLQLLLQPHHRRSAKPRHRLSRRPVDAPLRPGRRALRDLPRQPRRRRLPLDLDRPEESRATWPQAPTRAPPSPSTAAAAGAAGTTSRPANSTTSPPTTASLTGSIPGSRTAAPSAIASRSDYGATTCRDWHPVGGDERDYDIPDPGDPNIVYGSGLGGRVSRWDARTGEVHRRLALAGLQLRPAADRQSHTISTG